MRKLNLTDFMVTVKVPDPQHLGEVMDEEMPYKFKDSILNLMFNRDLQLNGAELVKQNVLAIKLEQCTDDFILLEAEEHQRLKKAIDTFKGFKRRDVELVTRINEAEAVEVEPKK